MKSSNNGRSRNAAASPESLPIDDAANGASSAAGVTPSAVSGAIGEFETYEDYLDSQVTATDLYYLESRELARQLVELGYRGSGEPLKREEFEARRRATEALRLVSMRPREREKRQREQQLQASAQSQQTGNPAAPQSASANRRASAEADSQRPTIVVTPFIRAIARRIQAIRDNSLASILFLRAKVPVTVASVTRTARSKSKAKFCEISSYIDFATHVKSYDAAVAAAVADAAFESGNNASGDGNAESLHAFIRNNSLTQKYNFVSKGRPFSASAFDSGALDSAVAISRRISPRQSDLSYYVWDNDACFSSNSTYWQVITEPSSKISSSTLPGGMKRPSQASPDESESKSGARLATGGSPSSHQESDPVASAENVLTAPASVTLMFRNKRDKKIVAPRAPPLLPVSSTNASAIYPNAHRGSINLSGLGFSDESTFDMGDDTLRAEIISPEYLQIVFYDHFTRRKI